MPPCPVAPVAGHDEHRSAFCSLAEGNRSTHQRLNAQRRPQHRMTRSNYLPSGANGPPPLPTPEAMAAAAAIAATPPVPLGILANMATALALRTQAMAEEDVAVSAARGLPQQIHDQASALAMQLRKHYAQTAEGQAEEQVEFNDFISGMSESERLEFFLDHDERPQDDPRRPKNRHTTSIRNITERFGVTHAAVNHWLAGGGQRQPLRHTRIRLGQRDRITILNQDLFDWLWTYRRDLVDKVYGRPAP
jgi:hypothetical protein